NKYADDRGNGGQAGEDAALAQTEMEAVDVDEPEVQRQLVGENAGERQGEAQAPQRADAPRRPPALPPRHGPLFLLHELGPCAEGLAILPAAHRLAQREEAE